MTDPIHSQDAAAVQAPRVVVYVGNEPQLIGATLSPLAEEISLRSETRVSAALLAAAQHKAHAVIVDLTSADDARTLLVAALAAARLPPRIIVLARRDDVEKYLRYPGVHSVIPVPMFPAQLRAAVSDRLRKPREEAAPAEAVPTPVPPVALKSPEAERQHAKWPGWRLYFLTAGRFMTLVSNLYKNAAFVLLATLFAAFTFYGFLIGYFLLSSSWGSPVTLTRGHQLVEKAVSDLADMKGALTLNGQRRSEAELEARNAKSAYDDAAVLVDFMMGTITSEIEARLRQARISGKTVQRLESVIKEFETQGGSAKIRSASKTLYDKRLITKKSYENQVLTSLEATQRLSGLETELDEANGEIKRLETSLTLLASLKEQLETGKLGKVESGSAELILLTKEAVDARSSLEQSASQLASANERLKLLSDGAKVLEQRISEIENGALGRAANGRIDVIFVPYGNERNFTPGAALYTCALTVIICHRAGAVGAVLPGESNAVHPFFGKPLRGFFVEARLDDPDAASEEIIHASRPPFFF